MLIFPTQKGYFLPPLSLTLIFCWIFYEVCTPIVLLLTNLYVLLDASIFFFLSFYLQHKIVLMLLTRFREKSYYNMSIFCVLVMF